MIGKISSCSNLYGVLYYNFAKVDSGEADVLLTSDLDGESIYSTLESFKPYLMANIKNEKPVMHISLNPAPGDRLSEDELKSVAQDWMKKMGYQGQPFIVFKHNDIDREHIHIVSTYVKKDGRSISRYKDFIRNKDVCREIEEKFNLNPATKKQWSEAAKIKAIDYRASDKSELLKKTIQDVIGSYRFSTHGQFVAALRRYNIHCDIIKRGEKAGITYSILDYSGRIRSVPINASELGPHFTYKNIEREFSKNKIPNAKKEKVAKIVQEALSSSISHNNFKNLLRKNNIDVIFHSNESRVYGVTVVDHYTKMAFKGSELSKELSADLFNSLIAGEQVNVCGAQKSWKKDEDSNDEKYIKHDSLRSEHDLEIDDESFLNEIDSLLNNSIDDVLKAVYLKKRKKKRL